MKNKVRIFGKDIKRAVRRSLMENIVEDYEMKDTYSRAKFKPTPREKEIKGAFGQYGEEIDPSVLRYLRKNPKALIKRLYDIYGEKLYDYISDYSNGEGDTVEFEEEIVGEEEQIAAKTAGTSYNFGKNPADWEKFNVEVGDDSKIQAREDGTLDVYTENLGKRVTVNEIRRLYEAKKWGKGCAESEGGSGCIKKDKKGWYILNNKKGGIFKRCSSKKDCEEILSVPGVHKG